MTGAGGGAAPLQYKFMRPPAPQVSFVLPLHGKLQSESKAFAVPLEMTFPQSYIPNHVIRTTEMTNKGEPWTTVETSLTTLLAILDTGINKVLRVAEIHAVFNSHIFCVRVADGCESACCDVVPNLEQSQKINSLARVVR
jgi:hypothetical protein